jgi:hypothetical protein
MQGQQSLDKCANEACSETFNSLGEGKLFVFPISNAGAWRLPQGMRQKVLWLCETCCKNMLLELDHDGHSVKLLPRESCKAA